MFMRQTTLNSAGSVALCDVGAVADIHMAFSSLPDFKLLIHIVKD